MLDKSFIFQRRNSKLTAKINLFTFTERLLLNIMVIHHQQNILEHRRISTNMSNFIIRGYLTLALNMLNLLTNIWLDIYCKLLFKNTARLSNASDIKLTLLFQN